MPVTKLWPAVSNDRVTQIIPSQLPAAGNLTGSFPYTPPTMTRYAQEIRHAPHLQESG
jgi:hypothetical protein